MKTRKGLTETCSIGLIGLLCTSLILDIHAKVN